ncbi:MAG: ribosome-associated translation inhibitor RaiA [Vicinamibacterales bacterium]
MRLELTGRHIRITPATRALVEDGLAHTLRKLNGSAVSAQVVLTQEKTRVHAEATLHAKGERFLHGEASGRDVPTAVAAVLDKIDRQAQRVKNKWADGKRQGISAAKGSSAAPRPDRAARLFAADEPPPANGFRVIRMRRWTVKQMSVDDAASVVGDTPNSFVVFRAPGAEAVSIVFRRPDGNVGLIEPGA